MAIRVERESFEKIQHTSSILCMSAHYFGTYSGRLRMVTV